MLLQNLNEEYKVNIDNSIEDNFILREGDKSYIIDLIRPISVEISESICITKVIKIIYDQSIDGIVFADEEDKIICIRSVEYDELITIKYISDNEDECIALHVQNMPKFMMFSDETLYPKLEIEISDCMYQMSIYIDEYNCIDIPWYQSHTTFEDTMKYIYEVSNYIKANPEFIKGLLTHTYTCIKIKTDNGIQYGKNEYNIIEDGINIFVDTDIIKVEWHKLFKLVMDGIWEMEFIDKEE